MPKADVGLGPRPVRAWDLGALQWTFLLGLCPRPVWDWAQGLYGPGISVPYNNPPLIHTQSLRRIKELFGPFDLENLLAWDL